MLFLQQVCFVRGNGQDAGEGLCGPAPYGTSCYPTLRSPFRAFILKRVCKYRIFLTKYKEMQSKFHFSIAPDSPSVLSGEMDRMRGRACADPPPMALPVLSAGFASRFADYQREGESGAMENAKTTYPPHLDAEGMSTVAGV